MTSVSGRRFLIVSAAASVAILLALFSVSVSIVSERSDAQETRELSLQNCTTVNANTEAVYQVVLAFQALADIINRDLPPDQELRVRVEEPEYLDC